MKMKKKKIDFEFVVAHGNERIVVPDGWIEYTRLLSGDEVVVLILPDAVVENSSSADLEREKNLAVQGVLFGQLLKSGELH